MLDAIDGQDESSRPISIIVFLLAIESEIGFVPYCLGLVHIHCFLLVLPFVKSKALCIVRRMVLIWRIFRAQRISVFCLFLFL